MWFRGSVIAISPSPRQIASTWEFFSIISGEKVGCRTPKTTNTSGSSFLIRFATSKLYGHPGRHREADDVRACSWSFSIQSLSGRKRAAVWWPASLMERLSHDPEHLLGEIVVDEEHLEGALGARSLRGLGRRAGAAGRCLRRSWKGTVLGRTRWTRGSRPISPGRGGALRSAPGRASEVIGSREGGRQGAIPSLSEARLRRTSLIETREAGQELLDAPEGDRSIEAVDPLQPGVGNQRASAGSSKTWDIAWASSW